MASPIEDALLDALGPVLKENGLAFVVCVAHDENPRCGLAVPDCKVYVDGGDHTPGQPSVLVCREATEAGYRVDLLLRLANVSRRIRDGMMDAVIAVECDGHEWHERTKQQAAYDRARDRELLIRQSLVTIRFAGSEIYRDANQCARECVDALLAVGALLEQGKKSG